MARLTSEFTVRIEHLISNLKHGLDLAWTAKKWVKQNGHFDRDKNLELMTDIFCKKKIYVM